MSPLIRPGMKACWPVQELSSFSVVANCTGLGAVRLFGDKEMYPVRGHVIRVRAPWIKYAHNKHSLQCPLQCASCCDAVTHGVRADAPGPTTLSTRTIISSPMPTQWCAHLPLSADSAQWFKQGHVLTQTKLQVLGGTAQQGDTDTTPREEDRQHIWQGCLKLMPSLSRAMVHSLQARYCTLSDA